LTPQRFAKGIKAATEGWSYDAVTVGLPAPIADGRPLIDPVNLGSGWTDFDFGALFPDVPCILANDAELQALGSWPGEGKMLYLGLGTGLGNAMVLPDQAGLPVVVPMELGHLPYRDGKTFEQCVGIAALKENGKKDWERDVFKTIEKLKAAMVADFVVLGGGNVKRLKELPADVHRGDNLNAFLGGFRLHDPAAVMPEDIHTKAIEPWGNGEAK
jgi:polyphosphate glucokinase